MNKGLIIEKVNAKKKVLITNLILVIGLNPTF